ncbi:MAG: hypothetical protein FJ009_21955 [Chloroflexi bacterium]|nr:hypothetical protein [Chloroflexota bacterium]
MDTPKTITAARVEQPTPAAPTKKPYAPPAIIYRAPLEATAGICTDSPGKAPMSCSSVYS